MTVHKLMQACDIFDSRLQMLGNLMAKAQGQFAGEDRSLDDIMTARVAPDMLPFPYQIVFACNQPNGFAAWVMGEEAPETSAETMSWEELTAHITETRSRIEKCRAALDPSHLEKIKTINLPGEMYLELNGDDYLAEWLMPNFYFHVVTAYNLMRMKGLVIGKADYMQHLMPHVRQK
ncbi:DUF1993 family protein [Parvularcula marina]|uniref:DUF1993 domain-containing protein n=1 Tax=Parvularcula marina TaxID=2292771 RepID=A0A371RJB8_9PROT|nr:DUF1993 domain-containing protein [Parvularcula marina]RFB05543.1 DUF1993 domain-containing protein [Parvularcula marina]